jgi:3-polyprenyl-4-hydroxybenzoate decarboxylase
MKVVLGISGASRAPHARRMLDFLADPGREAAASSVTTKSTPRAGWHFTKKPIRSVSSRTPPGYSAASSLLSTASTT